MLLSLKEPIRPSISINNFILISNALSTTWPKAIPNHTALRSL